MDNQDLTGQRFGRLVVDGKVTNSDEFPEPMWTCICDCGNETTYKESDLRPGWGRSCGCYNKSHLYACWRAMRSRCRNPKHQAYPNYGGRGIDICQEWFQDFDAFAKHIGPRPHKTYSIDRIDNDGNYEPGNVRWASMKAQARNTRSYHKKHGINQRWDGVVKMCPPFRPRPLPY